jgi:23S rRNA pseudouridine955/2504/2580 synthase
MDDIHHPVSLFEITSDYEGVRLDNCLISKMKGLPRTRIYSIIRKGEVRVNKSRSKPSLKLKKGDIVRIPPYRVSSKGAVYSSSKDKDKIALSIIRREKDFLIINKPTGIASHGGSGISSGVIEIIRELDPKYRDAHLAHRIDRDTSGCLVIALRKSFLRKLHEEIRNKNVDKIYDLVVFGKWPVGLTVVDAPLSKKKSESGEKKAFVESKGKKSLTEFNLVKTNEEFSHLKAKIITGRMHQIRVHAQFKGFPVVGDRKYGDKLLNKEANKLGLNRMLLHATSISFKNLDIECSSDVPDLFSKIMS